MVLSSVATLLCLSASAGDLPSYAEDARVADEVQVVVEEDPFLWTVESAVVRPGVDDRVTLRLTVPDAHLIYRDQLDVAVLDDAGLSFGPVDLPPATLQPDAAGDEREVYLRDVLVYLPVTAPHHLESGLPVRLQLRHQGCRPGLCFSPIVEERDVLVAVRSETAAPEADECSGDQEVTKAP